MPTANPLQQRGSPAQSESQASDSHSYDQAKSLQDRVTMESPEGRPAHPRVGRKVIAGMITGIVLLAAAVSLVFVILGNYTAAAFAGGLAVAFLLFNPVMWAAMLRGGERSRVANEPNG